MSNKRWRGFLIAKNSPVIRVHKDFDDWLQKKSDELHMSKPGLTKVLEMHLKTDGTVKIKKKKNGGLRFDFKILK